MTRVLDGDDPRDLDEAAAILRRGGLVAFPTETVYGLGALGLDAAAVARAFRAKGRPLDNPVILHVRTLADALLLWDASDEERARAERCAAAFWPGPLTLVLPAAAHVPDEVRAGLPTVAVRAPDHPVALALLARVGQPLAAPSANASGRPSPTEAEHVTRTLGGAIDAVLDGGATAVGVESTVLDLRGVRPRVLREGAVTRAELARVLGDVEAPDEVDDRAPSPGRRHRHYTPADASVRLLDAASLADAWRGDEALLLRAATARALREAHGARSAVVEELPDDAPGFARGLYAALYRLEGNARIALEAAPDDAAWAAVRDRLERAAGAS